MKQTELLSHEHFIEMKRVDLPFFCEVMRVALAIGDSPLSFRISFLGCSLSLHKQLLYAPRQIQAKGGRRKIRGRKPKVAYVVIHPLVVLRLLSILSRIKTRLRLERRSRFLYVP